MSMNAAEDQRLDHYLPDRDLFEKHEVVIRSSPEKVFETLLNFDMRGSKITGFLLSLRVIFEPELKKPDEQRSTFIHELTGEDGFMTMLEEIENKEIVIGFIGKFWQVRPEIFRPRNAEEYVDFNGSDYVKGAWNLYIESNDDGTVTLSTESRMLCIGNKSKQRFLPYWALIRLFSGLTRREMLRIIKDTAEGR